MFDLGMLNVLTDLSVTKLDHGRMHVRAVGYQAYSSYSSI